MNYKGRENQKTRNCPKCGQLMIYSSYTNMLLAEKDKSLCKECRRLINRYDNSNLKPFKRNCPKCNSVIGYKRKYDMLISEKKGLCHICKSKEIGRKRLGKTCYDIWIEKGVNKVIALDLWKKQEEKRIKTRAGYSHSDETLKKIKSGGFCKRILINGIECQGTWEKMYIENLIKENKELPISGNIYKTPFGKYIADFEFPDKIIEIKSFFTYKIFNKEIVGLDKKYSNQKEKVEYVGNNLKVVELLVLNKKGEIIKKEVYNSNVK